MQDNTHGDHDENKTYYLLKVVKGKERRVAEFLKNVYGIDARRSPLGEYLVCVLDGAFLKIKEKPEFVKEMNEVPSGIAGAIMKEFVLSKKNEGNELEVNGMIRVIKGDYEGRMGILKKIREDNTASVHLGLSGKMRQVILPVECIVANRLDEPWGI
ncbi:MAG TPA: hypothetical protein PK661_02810 [Syntrophorhabdaceae bacterium]|jgi:transcription antitermination factor NusG|nr:hypothetical protein [Syntrophorhabdaceae bacterium]MDI9559872.1 hypothetical protein [Pseudomonadota bacterium]HOS59003.1 hypothetical protein [Syntrophorhabdaceae bacterium]HQP51383.1 hypothetical protein [Syntrophorhabdaceae bacterium]